MSTFLIHGEAGVGKTWLVGSMPPPVCILDLEGRARYLPHGPKVTWDPDAEGPPEPGDWTHCVVTATSYQKIENVYQWLQSGRHPFRSFGFDSISFAQKRFISKLAGTSQLKDYDWGEVLRVLETMIRDCCDLTLQERNPIEVVAFTAGTKTEEGRAKPLLQGALKDTCAYLFDVVGYLYLTQNVQDAQGPAVRNLLIQPSAGIVAKDNTGRLGGPVVLEPDLTRLHQLANNQEVA